MSKLGERLRWLTPSTAIVLFALVMGVVWSLVSVRSPLALHVADNMAGRGNVVAAVDRYDAIADTTPSAWMRRQALWTAGNLLEVELRDPIAARRRFRTLSLDEEAPRRATALERVGRILQHDERRPEAAARAYEDAWRVAPEAERAGQRLYRAALAYQEAGSSELALAAWEELELGYPELRGRAYIGRAALYLTLDDEAAALAAYRDALEGDDEAVHAAARLGSATCLERLGNLDEALAELDAADLPEGVRDARAGTIRARLDAEE